jgi:hypothetical protein
MRSRRWFCICAFVFLCFGLFESSFSQDLGIPDTLRFGEWSTYVPGPPYQGEAIVPMVVFNDLPLLALRIPIKYAGPIECDTADFVAGRPDALDDQWVYYDTFDIDGISGKVIFLGSATSPPPMAEGVGEIAWIHFQVQDTGWAELDTVFLGPMNLSFMDTGAHIYYPQVISSQYHIVPSVPGDVNQDGEPNTADVVFLLNYLFVDGPPPDFEQLGDLNRDCEINSADIVYLLSFLFADGPSPQFGGC